MKNKDREISFIKVYYDNMIDLQVNYIEYIILYLMVKQSESNAYYNGIMSIAKWLGVSRTPIYETHLENLTSKNHIIKDENSNVYFLNADLKERIEQKNGKSTTIYRKFKSLGVTRLSQYLFYYSVFSLSRKQNYASANKQYYAKIIGIEQGTINTYIKDDFIIKIPNTNYMKLTPKKEKWFLERQNVQFLDSKI